MNLSEHINTKTDRVLCPHCGGGALMLTQTGIIDMFEELRAYLNNKYDQPIALKINSGYRCFAYNEDLKRRGYPASRKSLHLKGAAFDIAPIGITPSTLVKDCQKLWKDKNILTGGLGLYAWGVHIDTGKHRTWDYRK